MQNRKIYYLPGLISLICLPVLLYFFMPEVKERPVALKLFLPTDNIPLPPTISFSTTYVKNYVRKKKVKFLKLPYYYESLEGLEEYRYWSEKAYVWDQIRLGNLDCDTNKVFRIDLTSSHSYGDFIWLLNLAAIHGYRKYAYMENSFYFFPNPPPTPENFEGLGDISIEKYQIDEIKEPSSWVVFKRKFEWYTDEWVAMIKYQKTISIAFCILIVLPFLIRIFSKRTLEKVV